MTSISREKREGVRRPQPDTSRTNVGRLRRVFGSRRRSRGGDFWLSEYDLGVQTGKSAERTLNDISESFRLSDEADGLFPVLENPGGASQADIVGVINKFFNNMFGRDVQGSVDDESTELGEWFPQFQDRLQQDIHVGDLVIDIMEAADGDDRATLQNRIDVGDEYTNAYQANNATWTVDGDIGGARAIMANVTADPASASAAIAQAQSFALASVPGQEGPAVLQT